MEWEYRKATIRLNDQMQFEVSYPGEEGLSEHDSWAGATKAVDARREKEERESRVKIAVPVLCLNNEGKLTRHVVTGVHAGHGNYLARPAVERYGRVKLYLDHPKVEKLVKALMEARETVEKLEGKLEPFELSDLSFQRKDRNLDTAAGVKAWYEAADVYLSKIREAERQAAG